MQRKTIALIEKISDSLKPGSHPGLSRVLEFCNICNHPEQKLRTIHVAGTNGKGSVSNMLCLILTEAGYRTAVFNSPFLSSPLEYFRIDGIQISEERFVELNERLLSLALQMQEPPTEFEFYTVAALIYFVEEQCDFAVIEAGMGGRLDATNVLANKVLNVITNIGIDHQEYLGNTIEQIAQEKAGILKYGVPVAVYPSQPVAVQCVKSEAKKHQSLCITACESRVKEINFDDGRKNQMQYTTENGQVYCVELQNNTGFQRRNCALVLESVEILKAQMTNIPESAVVNALLKFKLPARFEVLCETPLMIADGGHNPQCIEAVMESMLPVVKKVREQNGRVIILSGIMRDKDYAYVYRRLSEIADEFIVVSANVSRALTTDELEAELLQYGKPIKKVATPKLGAELALRLLQKQDCLLVSGSFYIMSDILSVLKK